MTKMLLCEGMITRVYGYPATKQNYEGIAELISREMIETLEGREYWKIKFIDEVDSDIFYHRWIDPAHVLGKMEVL